MSDGTISGWDVEQKDVELKASSVSMQDLIQRFIDLKREFPPELLQDLYTHYKDHLTAQNNPHNVHFGQLVGNPIEAIFDQYFTGVVPDVPPTVFYDAIFEDLGDVTVSRSSPIQVIDAYGYLEEIPANTFCVDYQLGVPMIPVFPSTTNSLIECLPQDMAVGQGSCLNTTLETDPSFQDPHRLTNHRVLTDNTTLGYHGFKIEGVITPHLITTTSFFFYPIATTGYMSCVLITNDNLIHTTLLTIDLSTRSSTHHDEGHTCLIYPFPSGWMRVGVTSKDLYETDLTLHILYHPDPTPSEYTGATSPLFGLYGFQLQDDAFMGPYTPTAGSSASTAATTLTLTCNESVDAWMMSTAMQIPAPDPQLHPGIRVGTQYQVMLNNTQLQHRYWFDAYDPVSGYSTYTTSLSTGSVMYCAASYSLDRIKITTDQDGSVTHEIPGGEPRDITEIVIGPYPGYFKMVSLYPIFDTSQHQEFLTGAPTP